MLKEIAKELGPIITDTLVVAVIAFIGWLTSWLRTRFKINLDEARASALGIAIANAAGGVFNKLGEKAVTEVTKPSDESVKQAVAMVEKSVPDAIKHFGLSPATIAEKVVNAVGVKQAEVMKVEVK